MYWQSKRVLITGLSGFVGSHLAEFLVANGADVYGLIRRRADGDVPRNIRSNQLHTKIQMLTGDLLDPVSLGEAIDVAAPDAIFHLAAQSFVPRSVLNPADTHVTNVVGTLNLLEAIRLRKSASTVVFAGSSEEYGLVFTTERHYQSFVDRHGVVFQKPQAIPELPINENNPLRPMSPYGVSKVQCDLMATNYCLTYGLNVIISRAFNHEGPRRGSMFVTSVIAKQVADISNGFNEKQLVVGNVNSFRDWSHVTDMVGGYCLLAEKGHPGEVYNQGSRRTNSVVTYILKALEEIGENILSIETFKNGKKVLAPLDQDDSPIWGCTFPKTRVDSLILNDELAFEIEDEGIWVTTESGKIPIYFDPERFRPLDVPILLSDTAKLRKLGFEINNSLSDIVRDQVNFFKSEGAAYTTGPETKTVSAKP